MFPIKLHTGMLPLAATFCANPPRSAWEQRLQHDDKSCVLNLVFTSYSLPTFPRPALLAYFSGHSPSQTNIDFAGNFQIPWR